MSGPTKSEDVPQYVGLLSKILGSLLTLGSLAWAADVYRLVGLQLYNEQFLAAMLTITLALAYLKLPAKEKAPRHHVPWYDVLACLLAVGAGSYLVVQYPKLVDIILLRPTDAVVVGCVMVILTLEALRRATGPVLPLIGALFILYGLYGNHLPGQLAGRVQDWQRLSAYLAIDVNGILGTPMVVATTIVIAFILFGNLLMATGGSDFFTTAALVAMGRYRGGAAKIAVVGSALFGMISGSAVANVAAVGVVTIPLIKRAGYKAYQAGAIEAVGSTGGQLMPPVMGAAAFLMAEFLQIPYSRVCIVAIVPALLYYFGLFAQADLEAGRAGITRLPESEIPKARTVLAGWHFVVAFAVLIVCLFSYNLQAETAALYASLALIICTSLFGYKGKRPTLRQILAVIPQTGNGMVELLLTCAGAGIIIGCINVSGIGFGLSLALVQVGGGHLWVLLLLSAAVAILLGMGLPTIGVYVLLVNLVAPALVKFGVLPIAAHLFVMYFGMLSMITPPVAFAAYAAAAIAKADFWRTGLEAVRFGWTAFVVPFLFVTAPDLILIGKTGNIVQAVFTAFFGIWVATIGIVGYFLRPVSKPMRVVFFVLGVLALIPANSFRGGFWTDVIGVVGGIILVAREIIISRKQRRKDTPVSAVAVAATGSQE
jgi:TRAP transporter 4TM/12TM fusion protein